MIRGSFGGLYLLQQVFFQSSGDRYPWIGPLVVGVLGGTLIVLLITAVKKRQNNPASSQFNVFTMLKITKTYGLDTHQGKMLGDIFREDPVENPLALLKDTSLLDQHFKQAYRRIKDSAEDEDEAQRQIALFFSLRNAIEATPTGSAPSGYQIHRRFRRRQISTPCTLAMVAVREVTVHGKTVKKMSLDGQSYSGTIKDISLGGCSIQCNENIKPGARIKLEFAAGKSSIAVLGQVLRVNEGGQSKTIHMKLLKVPQGAQNAINVLVFQYNEG